MSQKKLSQIKSPTAYSGSRKNDENATIVALKKQVQELAIHKSNSEKYQKMLKQRKEEYDGKVEELKKMSKEFNDYKNSMQSLEEQVEHLSVKKEMVELKADDLDKELENAKLTVEELKVEIDTLKMEHSFLVNGDTDILESEQMKKMKDALGTLNAAKLELEEMVQMNESELEILKLTNTEQTSQIENLQKSVDEKLLKLKEAEEKLNALEQSESLIEQLTNDNMLLGDQVSMLKKEFDELSELKLLNDDIDEVAKKRELGLTEQFQNERNERQQQERKIEELEQSKEFLILKLKEHTKEKIEVSEEVNEMKEKLERMKERVAEDKGDRTRYKKSEVKEDEKIDDRLEAISSKSTKKFIRSIITYFPEDISKKEINSVRSIQIIRRLIKKTELLIELLRSQYGINEEISKEKNIWKNNQENLKVCVHFIITQLFQLLTSLNLIDESLERCSEKQFAFLANSYSEWCFYEKVIDTFVNVIQKNTFDEHFSIQPLERVISGLSNCYKSSLTMISSTYGTKHIFSSLSLGKSILLSVQFYGRQLMEIFSFSKTEKDEETPRDVQQILTFTYDFPQIIEEILNVLSSIERSLIQEEKENKFASGQHFKSDYFESLYDEVDGLTSKIIPELIQMGKAFHLLMSNVHAQIFLIGYTPDSKEKLIEKLDSCIMQCLDKSYEFNDDVELSENMKKALTNSFEFFTHFNNMCQNLEITMNKEQSQIIFEELKRRSPIEQSAEIMRETLVKAQNLQLDLDEKDKEIIKFQKMLKMKIDEQSTLMMKMQLVEKNFEAAENTHRTNILSCQKERVNIETKLRETEKELNEKIEQLEEQVETAENEKNEMKGRLRNITRKNFVDGMSKKSKYHFDLQSPIHETSNSLSPTRGLNSTSVDSLEYRNLYLQYEYERKNNLKLEKKLDEFYIEKLEAEWKGDSLFKVEKLCMPINEMKEKLDNLKKKFKYIKEIQMNVEDLQFEKCLLKIKTLKCDEKEKEMLLKKMNEFDEKRTFQKQYLAVKVEEYANELFQFQNRF
ncbi:hypothetical protein SNEBB_010077, partial [Seison nebaliae]